MTKEYIFQTEQFLPISLSEAWAFFSSPGNLDLLTPKDMDFKVLTAHQGQIYNHMIINYTVKPLFRIPLRWKTELLNVQEPVEFTDIQRAGPFKLWKHVHHFVEQEGGVLVKDKVYYQLPLGMIGRFAHFLLVKKRIEGIFSYRREVLEARFVKNRKEPV